MKKIFFSFAVFTAMFFMVGCGGSSSGNNDGESYSECSYGSYRCKSGDSYWCGYTNSSNDLIWQLSERCSYSCDDSTGKCSSSSGGGNSGDNSSGDNSGGNSGESNASECSSGQFKCEGNYSFYCSGGSWEYYDDCATAGCNSGTGQCNSGGCSSGQFKCEGNYSFYCSGGSWEYYDDCATAGCNSGTGQCNSGGNSGGSSSNAAYQTCCDLIYCFDACSDQNCRDSCVNNSASSAINDYNAIFNCGATYGCGPDGGGYYSTSCLSTYCASQLTNCCYEVDNGGGNSGGSSGGGSSGGGDSSSKSPCPPEASASVSGSTVKLRWTYKTSSICGIPTKTTVKWHDPNYGWIEAESRNASSFTSTSLGITGCGYQEDGRWLLLAGILVENDAGGNVAYCRCEIDAKECKCY